LAAGVVVGTVRSSARPRSTTSTAAPWSISGSVSVGCHTAVPSRKRPGRPSCGGSQAMQWLNCCTIASVRSSALRSGSAKMSTGWQGTPISPSSADSSSALSLQSPWRRSWITAVLYGL